MWVKTKPIDKDIRERAEHDFPPIYCGGKPGEGEPADIVKSHSLIPRALGHAFATFGALLDPKLPLTRKQQEMIAVLVSSINNCPYCMEGHCEFLKSEGMDERVVSFLRVGNYWHANLPQSDQEMLSYVSQVASRSNIISKIHHDRLKRHGFTDEAILQMTLLASWFSYINRVANSVGVGMDQDDLGFGV